MSVAQSQQLTAQKTLELYKNALNFNVIGRYDPKINQLLFHTSHAVIYKFENEEWEKTDYQGGLAVYARETTINPNQMALDDLFKFGLLLLNRSRPENFSIGIIPHKLAYGSKMEVEKNEELLIVKNCLEEVYGIWIFDNNDREKLYELLELCLNNDTC